MINMIIDSSRCTGCAACVNVCPTKALSMETDKYGFYFPHLSKSCVKCEKCINSCPVLNKKTPNIDTEVYAAYSKITDIRQRSTSGGIFTHLSTEVLKNNGIVYGAVYDEDYTVKHICIDNISDLKKINGAKYAQSRIGYCYCEVKRKLNEGQQVLFSGTPCQVEGLNSFLGKKYDNLILIDTVCHSVPSPIAWKQYVIYRSVIDNDGLPPESVNMRSKHTGWSNYSYSCVYSYGHGKEYSILANQDLFMSLFINGYICRESCGNCQFKGYDRVSDITLGDFWGIWDIRPDMDDNRGTSLLMIHSKKGNSLLQRIKKDIIISQLELEDSSMSNPALLKSSIINEERDIYLKLACKGDYKSIEKRMNNHCFLINKVAKIKKYCKRK